jgi:hypothetical protein
MQLPFNFSRKSLPVIFLLLALFLISTAGARAQVIIKKPLFSFSAPVNELSAPSRIITAEQPSVCEGQPVHISTGWSSSLSNIQLQWKVARNSSGPYLNVSGGSGANSLSYMSDALEAGTYYYVLASGNNDLSNEISVTVHELPHVSGHASATTVCNGTPISLCGHGALSYSWSGNVTDKEFFSPTSSFEYVLTGTDANGCSNSDTVSIKVNPLPQITAHVSENIVQSGTSVKFNGSGAQSYTWSNGVSNDKPFVPSETETYVVKGRDANGCENLDVITVVVKPSQEP